MGRQPCCDKVGLKRGPWTIEEDNKLMNFILNNGIQCWRLVPKFAGLMRCGKSCRLRWINYLRPDLKRGAWTDSEEDMIIHLHSQLGNRWSKIAAHFPGRTDNEIKNHWNTKIKKKLRSLGLDPLTHKPLNDQNILKKEEETSLSGEETMQSNRGKMVINQDHEQQNLISSTTCSTLDDQESNLYNQMEGSLDASYYTMGLMNGNHEFQLQEDHFQNWINTPIPWDIFNSHFYNY